MNKRHKYEYGVSLSDENCAATKVLRMTGKRKRVLEIGAGPGTITRLLSGNGLGECSVTAVEIDPEALPHLEPICDTVFQRDLNDPAWMDGLATPDGYEVIVAADVFEHLLDPWSTLKAIKRLLATNGSLVISLPHAGHNGVIAALLNGDFRYHDWGLLDRTHIRFFGLKNIEDFLTTAGYSIQEVDYVVHAPAEMELADLWDKLSPETRRSLEASKIGNIYQVILRACVQTPDTATGIHLTPKDGSDRIGDSVSTLPQIVGRARRLLKRILSRD